MRRNQPSRDHPASASGDRHDPVGQVSIREPRPQVRGQEPVCQCRPSQRERNARQRLGLLLLGVRLQQSADSAGLSVSELNAESSVLTAMVTANWR